MGRTALAIAAAAAGAVAVSRPLPAQDSAGPRLTLGGRPPAIETEAQLRARDRRQRRGGLPDAPSAVASFMSWSLPHRRIADN